jgi:hypothetical protein
MKAAAGVPTKEKARAAEHESRSHWTREDEAAGLV